MACHALKLGFDLAFCHLVRSCSKPARRRLCCKERPQQAQSRLLHSFKVNLRLTWQFGDNEQPALK